MSSTISVLKPQRRPVPGWAQRILHALRPYELLSEEDEQAGKHPEFRYVANFIEVWGLQAILFGVLALIAPRFLHAQLHSGLVFFLTVLGISFFITGPAEWFFHRFAMHQLLLFRLMPGLKIVPEDGATGLALKVRRARNSMCIALVYYTAKMAFSHGAHHKLTDVTPVNASRLAEMFDAVSRYEIVTNERTEHAVFPHGSVTLFWLFFLPLSALLQLAANGLHSIAALHIPYIPILTAFTVSLTWQVWLYENSHAIMHKPYAEWWRPKIQLPIVGNWFSKVYRFHFFHHMNEDCSLGVVGAVFFIYFWDQVFGTYKLARLELIDSASKVTRDVLEMRKEEILVLPGATPEDFAPPAGRRQWVVRLEEQAAEAQKMWNAVFVTALKEVRRRKATAQTA